MIIKIRNSRSFKATCVLLVLSIFFQIVAPIQALALTGGPAQPEFGSFTPIGTSDMVDLSSGDMNYNIPLLDVGGYPLNMAYSSGVGMDDEASWVGLGWNLSVGQINRNVRGIPDDFKGDEITYENYLKANITVGATLKFTPGVCGLMDVNGLPLTESFEAGSVNVGLDLTYNNYNGFSIKPSVGANISIGDAVSVGFNVQSGPDGLSVSPSVSLHGKQKKREKANTQLGASFGVSMNSRQGLSSMTVSASRSRSTNKVISGYKNGIATSKNKSVGAGGNINVGSSIGFTDELYTPSKRIAMVTGSFTVNAALGAEIFGGEGQGQITAYGTVTKIKESEKVKTERAYGYANTDLAGDYDILDFNREKDGAFSVNTTNLPITNYTYDIYNVQGQGVSGMYRPFRNQVGYVYDPYVQDGSFSGNIGFEVGTGNVFHAGLDIEATDVSSHSGMWHSNNNILQYLKENYNYNPKYEKIHYKNVGDLSVDKDWGMFNQTGDYGAINIPYVGSKFHRSLESKFVKKNNANTTTTSTVNTKIKRNNRQSRNQAIYNVTVGELLKGVGYGPCVNRGTIPSPSYQQTINSNAKSHHIGEVQIIRNDGARYIYGLPAYNTKKVEATFATNVSGNCNTGIVDFTANDLARLNDKEDWKNLPNDKYLSRTTTPAYVHTHLLTSVLSADYQDKTANGPTVDDFGSYTKFTYAKLNGQYKWRTPYNGASYNEGLKTDLKDDQGNYVYGEKEQFYVDVIETKTHIAKFHYSARKDAKGVVGEVGGIDNAQNSYKLDKISLYSIKEYDGQNPSNSIPIKEVNFVYDYSLCKNVPNNNHVAVTSGSNELSNEYGKLTLKKVYFTYRNSNMGKYTGYKFTYANTNPDYNLKGYDSWGNYKSNTGSCINTSAVTAAEFAFTDQSSAQNGNSAAWSLSDVDLPSGGKISLVYESDDYAYVQDKEALRMFKVVGAGNVDYPDNTSDPGAISSPEFSSTSLSDDLFKGPVINKSAKYLYVEVPETAASTDQTMIYNKYFKKLEKELIYFRFFVNMTTLGAEATTSTELNQAKFDYVSGYAEFDPTATSRIFLNGTKYYLSVPIKKVEKEGGITSANQLVNPISKAAWNFGRKYLSQHVYSMQPNGDTEDVEAMVTQLLNPNVMSNLLELFTGPNAALENKGIGRRFIKDKSWIRLMDPSGEKKGGGCRVKEVHMIDLWANMTSGQGTYETMTYGQKYSYRLDNNKSSGVATYEPIGNKENPFVQPVFSSVNHILAPDEDNFIEKPFGESFFPSPQVTYSRVSVSNLATGTAPSGMTNPEIKKLHRTGKVVTEFYTSKDYPTIVDQTELQADEDKHEILDNILKMYVRKHFTASQGYVIHLNDMNGKQKSQRVYAEGQDVAISGVDYNYENYSSSPNFNASSDAEQIRGKLNNNVLVINSNGSIGLKTIGVEVDVVNDFRENQTVTDVAGLNGNLATFLVGIIPIPIPLLLPDVSHSEDSFRSVSTTKVINTFGILKETIAYDAGAAVYTKNLAWDAETGEVLVTETTDEFSDKYYTMNYPAHWFYKGMGQASQNLGLEGSVTVNGSGYLMNNIGYNAVSDFLIEGDEMIISSTNQKAWISKIVGNQFTLIDINGQPLTGLTGAFEITRSGHRNLQSAGIMNVTLMRNPLTDTNGNYVTNLGTSFLASNNWVDWKIINAGAVDYSDNWKVGCECGVNLNGTTYNPFVKNEKGVWRTKSSRTYLTGRNTNNVTPRREGYFTAFSPMYKLSYGNSWYKNLTNWTFVAEVNKFSPYGFELENKDALERYSGAQYGYNNTLPMAVGANTQYRELGYDGFEDYGFEGCMVNAHFNFKDIGNQFLTTAQYHTGKRSIQVNANSQLSLSKKLSCSGQ
jgi:hypothetical protein